MKIYDAFTFYNEEQILKIRYDELYDSISQFCIVEGDRTFTGEAKPSYYDQINSLSKYKNKTVRFKISLNSKDAWENEICQRNAISYFFDFADPEDYVIISDVDEIPKMETVLSLNPSELPVRLDVKQFFWNLHWQVPDHCNQGARPVVAQVKHLHKFTPQQLRESGALKTVPDGGWHFSFFGSEEFIVNKIESFAHTEFNTKEYKELEAIRWRIKNGIDPFNRFPLKYTEINSTYPKVIQEGALQGN